MVTLITGQVLSQGTDLTSVGGILYTSTEVALETCALLALVPGVTQVHSSSSTQTLVYNFDGAPENYSYTQINQVFKKTAGGIDSFIQVTNDIKTIYTSAPVEELVASLIIRLGTSHTSGTVTGMVEHKLPIDAQKLVTNGTTAGLNEPFYGSLYEAFSTEITLKVDVLYSDNGICISPVWERDSVGVMRNAAVLSEVGPGPLVHNYGMVWTPSVTGTGYSYNTNLARAGQAVSSGWYKGIYSASEANFLGYADILTAFLTVGADTYTPNFVFSTGTGGFGALKMLRYLDPSTYATPADLRLYAGGGSVLVHYDCIGFALSQLPVYFTSDMGSVFNSAVLRTLLV